MKLVDDMTDARETAPTIGVMLSDACDRFAERTLIEFRSRAIGFGEMASATAGVAAALASRGVGKGDVVALYFPNTPHYPVMFFAAMRLGAVVVNLTPLDAARELRFKLADTGARIVATLDEEPFRGHAAALLGDGLIDLLLLGSDAFWEGGDPFGGMDVLAAGEAMREQRIGARPPGGPIEQRRQALTPVVGKIEAFARHPVLPVIGTGPGIDR